MTLPSSAQNWARVKQQHIAADAMQDGWIDGWMDEVCEQETLFGCIPVP